MLCPIILYTALKCNYYIYKHSAIHNIDPHLVRAIINTESNWRHNIKSKKGAIGIMQIKPITAKELNINPHDLEDNIRGGIMYISKLLNRFEHMDHALAAYNAGPKAVKKYKGVPPYKETKKYVQKVNKIYAQLKTGNKEVG